MIAKPLYLHLETDHELRQRLYDKVGRHGALAMEVAGSSGVALDVVADRVQSPRRIIEVDG